MLNSRAPLPRSGFTLTELLISMTLLALIGSVIVGVVISQSRFYRGTNELTETRAQLRQVAAMLPADLRGISAAGNDVYFMSDSAIEFRSTFGSSVVCKVITSSPAAIVLPPRNTAKGIRWTTWAQTPVVGDSIALYDEGATSSVKDDRWTMHRITGWTTVSGDVSSGCQSSSRLVAAADLTTSNPSFRLTLSPVAFTTTTQGSAVRFFKRVRYNLYGAADGYWYLGYRDCLASRTPQCSAVQPIGGPYRPYAGEGSETNGIQFIYRDSLDAITTDPKALSRITVVIRGESAEMVQLGGMQNGWRKFRDSLTLEVALRNRK